MKTEQINQLLEKIVLTKNNLQSSTSEQEKKTITKQLDKLESEFDSNYKEEMHEILLDVHDELCPDNDVQKASDYIAKQYIKKGKKYFVDGSQGLLVHMDDYPHQETKLVLLPNPLRVELNIDEFNKEEVWSAERNLYAY